MVPYPEIDPVAFSLGSLKVHWYGMTYLFALAFAWRLALHRSKNNWSPISTEKVDDLIFYGTMGVFLGGRIGYTVFYNWELVLHDPSWVFRVWEGGMSFHGGATGVILAIIIYSFAKKISLLELGDIICSVVPIGLFFGRIANYINSELWGKVTTVYWGVVFPNAGNLPRHPSQLYEAILEGLLIFLILFIMIKKNLLNYNGFISGSFLFLYGLFRIFVENFREPDLHIGYIYNFLTMGMILSFPFMIAGMCIMFYAIKINGKN